MMGCFISVMYFGIILGYFLMRRSWDKKKKQLMGHGQKMVIFGITTSTLKHRIFQTDEGKKEAAATKLKGRLTITGWWLTYPS